MIISKTLDYAVRTLVYLGRQPAGKSVYMKEIARVQHIPMSYLAKVLRHLVRAGIVSSEPGPNGGYSLIKSPEKVNLRHVYEAVEGRIRMVDCFDNPSSTCVFVSCCGQADIWHEVQNKFVKMLEEITLQDIISKDCNYQKLENTN